MHVAVNLGLAAAAVATAVRSSGAPVEAVLDEPGAGTVVVGLSMLAVYLVFAAFVVLPRALAGSSAAPGR